MKKTTDIYGNKKSGGYALYVFDLISGRGVEYAMFFEVDKSMKVNW